MLKQLRLTNYFYTDSLEVDFTPGLNIITGATGSGKSILVSALEAALGSRRALTAADPERKSSMECEFNADYLQPLLAEADLEVLPGLQVRRELRPDHTSRYFVNDTPVKLKLVRRLGSRLIDFHAQNDLSLLLQKTYHTAYVDTFGAAAEVRARYDTDWQAWRDLKQRLERLETELQTEREQRELHEFQLRELQAAGLREGEDEELRGREKLLANAETLLNDIELARQLLDGEENSLRSTLYQLQKTLERIVTNSGGGEEALNTLREAAIGIDDVSHQLGGLADQVEMNPERLEEIRQRLELLGGLKRKYGPTLPEVIARQQRLEAGENNLRELELEQARLAGELTEIRQVLDRAAGHLTQSRRRTGREIARRINPLLRELGIGGKGLQVVLREREDFPHPEGAEQCEFHIATNPGQEPEPLSQVASGGELSRIMLALKSISAGFEPESVLVFDEIDRGISGQAAAAVGDRLQALAQKHQVICITHLPQIAARADHHLTVIKESGSDRTRVRVEPLSPEQRIEELAGLVGGERIGAADLKYARELLAQQRSG